MVDVKMIVINSEKSRYLKPVLEITIGQRSFWIPAIFIFENGYFGGFLSNRLLSFSDEQNASVIEQKIGQMQHRESGTMAGKAIKECFLIDSSS